MNPNSVEGAPHSDSMQARLKAIFDQSTVGIAETDFFGRFTSTNGRFQNIVDRTAGELTGMRMQEITHSEDVAHSEILFAELARTGEPFTLEKRYLRPDGSHVWVRSHVSMVRGEPGGAQSALAIVEDITEKKASIEQLQRQWRTFDTALSHTPDSTYIIDRNGRFLYANRALLQRWQKTLDQAVGKSFAEMGYPPSLVQKVEQQIQTVVETRLPIRDETSLGSFTPTEHYYEYIFVPVLASDGTVEAVAGSTRDITDQKAVQHALFHQAEELTRINADLEQFAYSASHDLREPLRMVSIFTQMLQKKYAGKLDAEGDEYISQAFQAARRMEMLVRDLLAYTRAAMAGEEEPELVDANVVFDQVLQNLRPVIQQNEAIVLRTPLPSVRIHEVHLLELFQNLIGNALKYRSENVPKIQVAAEQQEDRWVFSVADNGIGIDPAYAGQIFGIFKRLHNKDEYEGTGIGLAICQKIVERYAGRVWVESELGHGARFFFTLPVSE